MKSIYVLSALLMITCIACVDNQVPQIIDEKLPFTWDNASIYFLLTDRFNNGDKSNDFEHDPRNPPAPYRGFMGGDLKGVTAKINDGYFTELGIDALWMTPFIEQIQGSVDEGTGTSYAYHGYWTRDWTAIDPRFGTEEDLRELVAAAHSKGIRILIDVVANHTGPVTDKDSKWPDEWVKTKPRCTYQDFETTVNCTLVDNLPDIRTESNEAVQLPDFLIEKWKAEGRYEQEVSELDQWFEETGYPRTPVYYILKWLVDFIKDYGVDGYRVDTAKHTEGYIWKALYESASAAFEDWKDKNPDSNLGDVPFYMVGEVYNYYAGAGREFDYGDTIVDFFDEGFTSLINFDFKSDAGKSYEEIYSKYDSLLSGPLTGKTIVHYISSHDDGNPFDRLRNHPIESATKLMLSPGGVQIYYGDETARSLSAEADGDAQLRSYMNWDELAQNVDTRDGSNIGGVLDHWRKLGKFRKQHPAVGAGRHRMISDSPYTFSRLWEKDDIEDKVVIAIGANDNPKEINVSGIFNDGETVKDYYSDTEVIVENGFVKLESPFSLVLLAK